MTSFVKLCSFDGRAKYQARMMIEIDEMQLLQIQAFLYQLNLNQLMKSIINL